MAQPTAKQTPTLPLGIIVEIVNCFSPKYPDAILPASDGVTKALITMTKVCWAIYPVASRLLYQHCVYVDSRERAIALARALSSKGYPSLPFPWKITKIFLGPYNNENGDSEEVLTAHEADDDSSTYGTSGSSLDDRPLALSIRDLLTIVAPTLRVLVIDMPLRGLYPEDDANGVRPLLRQGFSSLVNLEAFVSVRDELYLDVFVPQVGEPPVWATCWPKLRYLSLYNVDFDNNEPWSWLVGKPHLQMAMFSRPDGCDRDAEEEQGFSERTRLAGIDIKRQWLKALEIGRSGSEQQHLPTSITLVFVDADLPRQPDFGRFERGWCELDPENKIEVLLGNVPYPIALEDGFAEQLEICEIETTQEFVKRRALEGTLWDKDAPWIHQINL